MAGNFRAARLSHGLKTVLRANRANGVCWPYVVRLIAAHEEYLKGGGKPLNIEGIRRLVAERRGGLRDD